MWQHKIIRVPLINAKAHPELNYFIYLPVYVGRILTKKAGDLLNKFSSCIIRHQSFWLRYLFMSLSYDDFYEVNTAPLIILGNIIMPNIWVRE